MLRSPKLLALIAGAASATGFAPLGFWPVTLACFALLIELIARAPNGRGAFVRGWLFGVGHFTVGLNWIAHAFTFQETMPHWFGYGAVVLLSLYLAVYPALAGVAAHLLSGSFRAQSGSADPGASARRPSTAQLCAVIFAFAAAWIATEYLRATVFTGFAWNPIGVIALSPDDAYASGLAGLSRWIGTYGVSGLVVAFAGLWWLALSRGMPLFDAGMVRPHGDIGFRYVPKKVLGGLLLAAFPLLFWMGGTGSISVQQGGTAVRIVQPNVNQDEKYGYEAQVASLKQLIRMSGTPDPSRPRLLLWPEAAIDNGFYLEEEPELRRFLARAIGPRDLLLTGGVAIEYDRSGRSIGARNSVFALGPDARVHGRYDKSHLVPYGEYLPMRAILTPLGLSRLVPGDLDFWPGPGPTSFDLPGFGLVGFQICYEIIFSGQVVEGAKRPLFLFNPSNDAWFGSWGPPQHLAQARLRAIEEGMTIVRATPTGISGVIAPDGRLVARIGQGTRGVLDAVLPLPNTPTLFARHGNILSGLFALLLAGLAVVFRLRAR